MALKELPLGVNSSFQFLYPFRFGLKQEIMLLVRHCLKVLKSIIILNPIKVVNYPSVRQELTIGLFPNKPMFGNVTLPIGFRVARCPYTNITLARSRSTAFPSWVFIHCQGSKQGPITYTTPCKYPCEGLTTVNTIVGLPFGFLSVHLKLALVMSYTFRRLFPSFSCSSFMRDLATITYLLKRRLASNILTTIHANKLIHPTNSIYYLGDVCQAPIRGG